MEPIERGNRLFIDCEFDGFGGPLLSMALVHEDARCEWYGVIAGRRAETLWVQANVEPVLYTPEPTVAGTYPFVRMEFLAFLRQFDEPPVIVADWHSDIVHFFALLGGRDHTETVHYPCRVRLLPEIEIDPAVPHNALSDARAIARAVTALERRQSGRNRDGNQPIHW